MGAMGLFSRVDADQRARGAAENALRLDSSLTGAVVTLATIKAAEWDWLGAEQDLKRMGGSDLSAGKAHQAYSTLLPLFGRNREAVAEARRAHEILPLSYGWSVNLAMRLYVAREYDEAESEARKLIDWEPNLSWGHSLLASVYLKTGRQRQAVAELRRGLELHHGLFELMYLGHALGVTGARTEARGVLDEMSSLSQHRYVPPTFIGVVYEGLGDRDRAIEWFKKAFADRSMHIWVLPDPRLDQIRTDPRFALLMRRMGLPR